MYRSLCLVSLFLLIGAFVPAPAYSQHGHGGGHAAGGGVHVAGGGGGGAHIGGGVHVSPSQHFGGPSGIHSPSLGGIPQHIVPTPQHLAPQIHTVPQNQHGLQPPLAGNGGQVHGNHNSGQGSGGQANGGHGNTAGSTGNPPSTASSNHTGHTGHDKDGDHDGDGGRNQFYYNYNYNLAPYRFGYGGLGYSGLGYGGFYRGLGYGGYGYGVGGYPYYASNLGYGLRSYGNWGYNYIPYYYGYLSGVPYVSVNNYSPAYYSQYSVLPSSTGMVTTYNAISDYSGASNSGSTETQSTTLDEHGSSQAITTAANDSGTTPITDSEAEALLQKSEGELASGNYQQAVVDAGKAAYALHEDSSVHEVLWLALFGLGDYRGAAIEAHAVDHFGVTPNWNDVAMKHESPTAFSEHMTRLETFVKRNQDADFASFLLGYNYLVLGHRDAAKQWLEATLKMDSQDAMCAKLVASLQSAPTEIAKPSVGLLPSDLSHKTSPES